MNDIEPLPEAMRSPGLNAVLGALPVKEITVFEKGEEATYAPPVIEEPVAVNLPQDFAEHFGISSGPYFSQPQGHHPASGGSNPGAQIIQFHQPAAVPTGPPPEPQAEAVSEGADLPLEERVEWLEEKVGELESLIISLQSGGEL